MLSPFDIHITHHIEEIGPEAWNKLAGQHPFADYRWYRYGEMVLADDRPVYIILSHQGQALARATFWLKKQEMPEVSSILGRWLVKAILKRWPLLACRAPLADASGWILPDPPLRDQALRVIIYAAQEQARRYHASFLLFDYLNQAEAAWTADSLLVSGLPGAGTRLTITWPDFDAYLRHLSQSMQKDYRRHCHRAADLGIEVKVLPLTGPLDEAALNQALPLIHNVERRHGSLPTLWARAMLKNAYIAKATWLMAEIDGRLVGCGLLVGSGDTQEMKLLGLDNTRYVYFQIIYAAIRRAIESGCRVLYGGSGAYELKQRLGFDAVNNNYIAYTANNGLLRWIARQLAAH